MTQRKTVEADLRADTEWMTKIEREVRSRVGSKVQAPLEVEIKAQIEARVQKQIDRDLKKQLRQGIRAYRREVEAEMEEETWRRIRERMNYPIFMAMTGHVGYDATDRPDENDLFVLDEHGRIDETKGVLGEYQQFLANPANYDGNQSIYCRSRQYCDIHDRLDPLFYHDEYLALEK